MNRDGVTRTPYKRINESSQNLNFFIPYWLPFKFEKLGKTRAKGKRFSQFLLLLPENENKWFAKVILRFAFLTSQRQSATTLSVNRPVIKFHMLLPDPNATRKSFFIQLMQQLNEGGIPVFLFLKSYHQWIILCASIYHTHYISNLLVASIIFVATIYGFLTLNIALLISTKIWNS